MGAIVIPVGAEVGARTRGVTILTAAGSRAGTARSSVVTILFNCGVRANAATRQIRGSAGPETLGPNGLLNPAVLRSSAISMGVTSQRGQRVTLTDTINCRAVSRV
jgi:hypothetical protein